MKNKRRYREKDPQLFISGCHSDNRIHDFLKGWGTIEKDGSILWDTWRPPTKKQREKSKKRKVFPDKIPIPPYMRILPQLSIGDIVNVQPMQELSAYKNEHE